MKSLLPKKVNLGLMTRPGLTAVILALGLAIVCSAPASAQTATTFTYQGHLAQDGMPADGTYEFEVRLLDSLGGQVGLTQTLSEIVTDGVFTIGLDFGDDAFDGNPRFLEIAVRSVADGGAYTLLSPNQPVTSAPVAQFALAGNEGPQGPTGSQGDQGVPGPPGDSLWTLDGSEIYYNAGNVGIGTTIPSYPLEVLTLNSSLAIDAENRSPSGTAVYGLASATTGTTNGVLGLSSSTSGRGVFGRAIATTGTNYGVRGENQSTSGRGVYGEASATTGTTYGVVGVSFSTSGRGVFGQAFATSGITYGVRGVSNSTSGRGAHGYATHATGINYGVVGRSDSPNGFDFYASGAGTNYGSSSSRRWKSNVVPINDPLAKLAKLRGVYFDWDEKHGGAHDVGMIAEEVGLVMPEIVQYEKNGIDAIGMDYSKMTPLLVEALNALRAEKDAEIQQLQNRLDRLEQK